ncbi:hypothetical protein LJC45_03165 [Alistipes sp. OttesenSCG-928-B03]|nr:hypothetical protein [Alistipes sp. OttesenSCG-928-B03]
MSQEEFDRLLEIARQTKDKDGYYLWGDRWVKDTREEESRLMLASSENAMSVATLHELMRAGEPFDGRFEMQLGRPKLKASFNDPEYDYPFRWVNTWYTDDIYDIIIKYLLLGKVGTLPNLKYGDHPEFPVEADYLYRHIKREIARGEEWVIFKDEDNGIRVIAKYPYGSLDYGIFPHTIEELHEYLADIQPFIFDAPLYDIPDLHNNKLPTEYRELAENKHLDSVFTDNLIPRNTIIDKTICGCGATWLEIHAERNSVIIEPNVPVIIGKMQQHPNIIGIYGEDMTAEKIAEKIRGTEGWVKLMTTPDSYPKIVTAFKEVLHLPFYNNYFLLFDECEKIVSDIDFRKNIALPIDDFFLFKDKAMVSATPIIIDDPRFEQQGFKIIKITPTYEYRNDLKLIATNIIPKTVKTELDKLEGTVCIFYNSLDGIEELIDFLKLEESEVNIYCSTDAKKKLNKDKQKNAFDSITDKLNHYNFFTSRFYSAVDIKVDCQPHVVMITEVYRRIGKLTPYSLIDPETEAIQIAGRFRNGIDTLIHITNTNPDLEFKSKDELEQFLIEQHEGYTELAELKSQAESKGKIHFFSEAINRTDYVSGGFVTNDGRKNYFRYNNAYLDERLKMLYCSPARLFKAYSRTGAFNIQSEGVFAICSDEERRKLRSNKTPKAEKIKLLHKIYSNATDSASRLDKKLLAELQNDYSLYFDAFRYIGFHRMRKLEFKDSAIKKEVRETIHRQLATREKVCKEVYKIFSENQRYSNSVIEEHIKKIYDANGIDYGGKGISAFIDYYFFAKKYRTENERGWELGLKRSN